MLELLCASVSEINSIEIKLIVYRTNLGFSAGIALKFDKAWEKSFRRLFVFP